MTAFFITCLYLCDYNLHYLSLFPQLLSFAICLFLCDYNLHTLSLLVTTTFIICLFLCDYNLHNLSFLVWLQPSLSVFTCVTTTFIICLYLCDYNLHYLSLLVWLQPSYKFQYLFRCMAVFTCVIVSLNMSFLACEQLQSAITALISGGFNYCLYLLDCNL